MNQHEELLDRWGKEEHHCGQGFIPDGIIDQDKWAMAHLKILFLLKESYDVEPDPNAFDLRGVIRDKWRGAGKNPTYRTISYWAYGLHQASINPQLQFPPWKEIPDDCSDNLLSSAVMNIKKSGGKSSSNSSDLEDYAKKDECYIRDQVNIIKPDIVVCGSVWWLIKKYCWPTAQEISDCVYTVEGQVFIDFWHPAYRAEDQMKYYALVALVQNSGVLHRCRH